MVTDIEKWTLNRGTSNFIDIDCDPPPGDAQQLLHQSRLSPSSCSRGLLGKMRWWGPGARATCWSGDEWWSPLESHCRKEVCESTEPAWTRSCLRSDRVCLPGQSCCDPASLSHPTKTTFSNNFLKTEVSKLTLSVEISSKSSQSIKSCINLKQLSYCSFLILRSLLRYCGRTFK